MRRGNSKIMPSQLARPHGSSTSPPSSLARLASSAWLGRFGCDQIWGVKAQQQIGVDSCLGVEYTANAIEPAVRARAGGRHDLQRILTKLSYRAPQAGRSSGLQRSTASPLRSPESPCFSREASMAALTSVLTASQTSGEIPGVALIWIMMSPGGGR
jgi:hypothetical protein